MIVTYIAAFVVILCFSMFSLSYQINGLNRLVVAAPMSLIEVNTIYSDEKMFPYLKEDQLEELLTYYFDTNAKRYVPSYDLDFYYYNQENHSYCVSGYCKAVDIKFSAEIMYGIKYERTMYYEIVENF